MLYQIVPLRRTHKRRALEVCAIRISTLRQQGHPTVAPCETVASQEAARLTYTRVVSVS